MQVLKTNEEYRNALVEVERLIDRDPKAESAEAKRLEVLALLVRDYETQGLERIAPDPVEAIRFRMEQQNLTPRDLVPFIGSRSKVSEILSGKRPLTLSMIRALHNGLSIPAKSLLQEQQSLFDLSETEMEWNRVPLEEMVERGWIEAQTARSLSRAEVVRRFFAPVGSPSEFVALYKQTRFVRCARAVDHYALTAWTARVLDRALKHPPRGSYQPGCVTVEFMREVARLSTFDKGPQLAREFLSRYGISLVIEAHLPKTYLDGASTLAGQKQPVIGLTVRHDRIDNFWYTLMHELAHLSLHLSKGIAPFYDDLDVGDQGNDREKEADALAAEALVPESEWRKSPARTLKTPFATKNLADRLRIHPAIVAGCIQHRSKDYQKLSHLLGRGLIRPLFPDVCWTR